MLNPPPFLRSTEAYAELLESVLIKIRAAVASAVRAIRKEQTEQVVLGRDFIDAVVDQLRPTIVAAVSANVNEENDDAVVSAAASAASARLESAVRSVSSSTYGLVSLPPNFYSSSVYSVLSDKVLADVRVVAQQELTVLRSRQTVDKAALVTSVASRVTPTVRAAAARVVSVSYPAGASVEAMVQEVVEVLTPGIYR